MMPAVPRLDLSGKRILVTAVAFFGYEKRVAAHLRERGALVDVLPDRPWNSVVVKILARLKSVLLRPLINAYVQRALAERKGADYDEILFISPDSIRPWTIPWFRAAFPKARLILYMWDTFRNRRIKDVPGFISLFDRALTFDDQDARTYGITFRPTFYTSEPQAPDSGPATYAFSFVGTIHSDRYRILMALKQQADRHGLATFIYPYFQTPFLYYAYRLFKAEFRGTRRSDFRFTPMPLAEVLRVFAASTALLDMEHPGQHGLTMRALDAFAAGKKLLTSNPHTRHYPFYSPDRICIFQRQAPQLDPAFFNGPPPQQDPALLDEYSITRWTDTVFAAGDGRVRDPILTGETERWH